MRSAELDASIQELEGRSKQGESYSNGKGRHGWRNPIRADTGELLHGLVLAASPLRVLEIGTGHGLSTLYLAAGLPPDRGASLETIDFDEQACSASRSRFEDCGLAVTVHCGEALEVIEGLVGRFDCVFFDAQKDMYLRHWQALERRELVGAGTLMLADNVIDRESECRDFLDRIRRQAIAHTIMPTECGLLVARL